MNLLYVFSIFILNALTPCQAIKVGQRHVSLEAKNETMSDVDNEQEAEENYGFDADFVKGCKTAEKLTIDKKSENVILVTNIDLNGKRVKFGRKTLTTVEKWAEKNEADVVVMRRRMPFACEQGLHVNFDVLYAIKDLLKSYKRVISVDDTYVFSPNAPNVLNKISESNLGGVREQGNNANDKGQYLTKACEHYNVSAAACLARFEELPLNGGLMIFSQKHAETLLNDIEQPEVYKLFLPLHQQSHFNQPFWNARIAERQVPVQLLEKSWGYTGKSWYHASNQEHHDACAMHMTKYVYTYDLHPGRPPRVNAFGQPILQPSDDSKRIELAGMLIKQSDAGKTLQCVLN